MWLHLLLLLFSFIALGEYSIFLFVKVAPVKNSFWLFYMLLASFAISIIMINEKRSDMIRRYIQLESLFFVGMVLYVYMLYKMDTHPLVSFGYFMIYSMILSAVFIFREFSSYLYILSCSLLIGVAQIYESSIVNASIFLILLIFTIVNHNDYMNYKYNVEEIGKKKFPLITFLSSTLIGLLILFWMSHATPEVSNYLESWKVIRQSMIKDHKNTYDEKNFEKLMLKEENQENQENKEQEETQGKEESEIAKNTANQIPEQKSNVPKQENLLDDPSQVSMNNDLKFGDIDLDDIEPKKLFDVQINEDAYKMLSQLKTDMYWKLGHLDSYDSVNGYWYLRNSSRQKMDAKNNSFMSLGPLPTTYVAVWQKYTKSVTDERTFYLTNPVFPPFENIHKDSGDNIFMQTNDTYEVMSYVAYPVEGEINFNVSSIYYEMPVNAEYRKMAQQITKNIDSTYKKINSIRTFLRRNYKYDLKPGIQKDKGDVTYQFLFKTYRGYCQHFSSAMVLLLRSIGIPARVSVGCRGGTFDTTNTSFSVTTMDQHAWVEVPVHNLGWVIFDPVADGDEELRQEFENKIKETQNNQLASNKQNNQPGDETNSDNSNNPRNNRNPNSRNNNGLNQNTSNGSDDFNRQENNSNKSNNNNKDQGGVQNDNSKNDRGNGNQNKDSQGSNQRNNRKNNDRNNRDSRGESNNKNKNNSSSNFEDEQKNKNNKQESSNNQMVNQDPIKKEQQQNNGNVTPVDSSSQTNKQNTTTKQAEKQNTVEDENIAVEQTPEEIERQKDKDIIRKPIAYETNKANKNNSLDLSNNNNRPDSITTFAKNMAFFVITLFGCMIFFYLIPRLLKLLSALLKILFSPQQKKDVSIKKKSKLQKIIEDILPIKRKIHTDRGKVIYAYSNLSERLEKYGLDKKRFQTPTEYQKILQNKLGESFEKELLKMTQLFTKARYSYYQVEPQDVAIFENYCKQILENIKKVS